MKTIKILLPVFIVAICIAVWVSCDNTDDSIGKEEQEFLFDNTSADLDTFILNHFEKEFSLSLEKSELRSASTAEDIYSDFSVRSDAEAIVNSFNDIRAIRSNTEEQYLDYKVKTKILDSSIKKENDQISFQVYVYHKYYTDSYDIESGEQINPSGISLYGFVVEKNDKGYLILKENIIDFTNGPEYDEFVKDPEISQTSDDNNNLQLRAATSYSYSKNDAVSFAQKYCYDVSKVKNYCDYTKQGGDCTNFLSWCLYKGGWVQNDFWFFISDGSSGISMKKYKRSPSWTGANYFYQYISATGSTYSNAKGNKRVTLKFKNLAVPKNVKDKSKDKAWVNFYNNIKKLGLGDIVEIGNGSNSPTITHNMIITKISSKEPYVYVSFRSDTKNGHTLDLQSNQIPSGNILYGFKVNSSSLY